MPAKAGTQHGQPMHRKGSLLFDVYH